MDTKKFIDLHVHIGPEIFPRKFTVPKIVKEETGKIRGIALKNHFFPTMPLIKTIEEPEDLILIGSVTLNNYLGGLNPNVIYGSAKISRKPIIVWFPTISAINFLRQSKYEIPPEWAGEGFKPRLASSIKGIKITDTKGNLIERAKKILKVVKENDSILATGHLSWYEAKVLVEEAVRIGIKRIIITHPIYQLINMPIDIQKKLARNKGVYIEQSYAMYLIDKIPIKKIVEQIKAVKPENCIISSDVGQINSPNPSEALKEFSSLLIKNGLDEDAIKQMAMKNPEYLIKS